MNHHNILFWNKQREGHTQVVNGVLDSDNLKTRETFLLETLSYAANMASWYADKQHDNAELYRYLGQINAVVSELAELKIERAAQSLQPPVWTLE